MIIVHGKNNNEGELETMAKTKTTKQVDELQELSTEENVIEEVNMSSQEVVEEVKEDLPPHVDVKPDPVQKPKKLGIKKGTVINCQFLRIREGANIKTKQLAILQAGQTVDVNLDNSTETFYEVSTQIDNAVVIGYCVKEFISLGK